MAEPSEGFGDDMAAFYGVEFEGEAKRTRLDLPLACHRTASGAIKACLSETKTELFHSFDQSFLYAYGVVPWRQSLAPLGGVH